jgi:response regulator RpfG family c-di-GMP phosphodiesterase
VLAKYLHGGNPQLNAFTTRVVNLSQRIAQEMRLSSRRIDDIRVAALLQGFSKIEVTTKVISKAVHCLETKRQEDFSFHGTDLVYSLGAVLRGAIPILLTQDTGLPAEPKDRAGVEAPIGAKILIIARAYESLNSSSGDGTIEPAEIIRELRADAAAHYDLEVLDALERAVAENRQLVGA